MNKCQQFIYKTFNAFGPTASLVASDAYRRGFCEGTCWDAFFEQLLRSAVQVPDIEAFQRVLDAEA